MAPENLATPTPSPARFAERQPDPRFPGPNARPGDLSALTGSNLFALIGAVASKVPTAPAGSACRAPDLHVVGPSFSRVSCASKPAPLGYA